MGLRSNILIARIQWLLVEANGGMNELKNVLYELGRMGTYKREWFLIF